MTFGVFQLILGIAHGVRAWTIGRYATNTTCNKICTSPLLVKITCCHFQQANNVEKQFKMNILYRFSLQGDNIRISQ